MKKGVLYSIRCVPEHTFGRRTRLIIITITLMLAPTKLCRFLTQGSRAKYYPRTMRDEQNQYSPVEDMELDGCMGTRQYLPPPRWKIIKHLPKVISPLGDSDLQTRRGCTYSPAYSWGKSKMDEIARYSRNCPRDQDTGCPTRAIKGDGIKRGVSFWRYLSK